MSTAKTQRLTILVLRALEPKAKGKTMEKTRNRQRRRRKRENTGNQRIRSGIKREIEIQSDRENGRDLIDYDRDRYPVHVRDHVRGHDRGHRGIDRIIHRDIGTDHVPDRLPTADIRGGDPVRGLIPIPAVDLERGGNGH